MVCRNFRHTTLHGAIEGKTQEVTVKYYNLDVIISVGYRVKSHQGTQFRIWTTQHKFPSLFVEQYLAFAETMAQQQTPMYMKDWIARLDTILQMNNRELLEHAGKISHQMALDKSEI